MVSTGIYVRVSTEEQVREGYSIRAQEEKLRAYAKVKDWHIYGVYADEGISGKDIDGRPAIKQLIADITSGKVNNVLIYKVDRLTRSTKNLIELVELFNQHHCAFNSLQEAIDTNSATGRMFLKIVGIFAEFERENLVERVRLGMERKVKEGYSLCSYITSYGYNRENGNKVQEIADDEAEIVRRIFNMYLNDNYSYTQIANILNVEKIPTKKEKIWAGETIKGILTNPTHIGKVRYSIEDTTRYFETDGKHEPIIDENTYYQVQEKIGKVKRASRTKHPSSAVYFCGVLYCPLCGSKYSTHWSYNKHEIVKDGQRPTAYPSYRCRNGFRQKCKAKIISHNKVERAFEQHIAQIEDFTKFDNIEIDSPSYDNSTEIEIITAEIKQIEKKTEEIMSLFVSNTIDFATYQGMVRLSNERKGELEARLNLLQSTQKSNEVIYTVKDIVSSFHENWLALDNDQRQQFVQKFIKKVVVNWEAPNSKSFSGAVIDKIVFNEF